MIIPTIYVKITGENVSVAKNVTRLSYLNLQGVYKVIDMDRCGDTELGEIFIQMKAEYSTTDQNTLLAFSKMGNCLMVDEVSSILLRYDSNFSGVTSYPNSFVFNECKLSTTKLQGTRTYENIRLLDSNGVNVYLAIMNTTKAVKWISNNQDPYVAINTDTTQKVHINNGIRKISNDSPHYRYMSYDYLAENIEKVYSLTAGHEIIPFYYNQIQYVRDQGNYPSVLQKYPIKKFVAIKSSQDDNLGRYYYYFSVYSIQNDYDPNQTIQQIVNSVKSFALFRNNLRLNTVVSVLGRNLYQYSSLYFDYFSGDKDMVDMEVDLQCNYVPYDATATDLFGMKASSKIECLVYCPILNKQEVFINEKSTDERIVLTQTESKNSQLCFGNYRVQSNNITNPSIKTKLSTQNKYYTIMGVLTDSSFTYTIIPKKRIELCYIHNSSIVSYFSGYNMSTLSVMFLPERKQISGWNNTYEEAVQTDVFYFEDIFKDLNTLSLNLYTSLSNILDRSNSFIFLNNNSSLTNETCLRFSNEFENKYVHPSYFPYNDDVDANIPTAIYVPIAPNNAVAGNLFGLYQSQPLFYKSSHQSPPKIQVPYSQFQDSSQRTERAGVGVYSQGDWVGIISYGVFPKS